MSGDLLASLAMREASKGARAWPRAAGCPLKDHLALPCLIQNSFRNQTVVAVRLAAVALHLPKFPRADSSAPARHGDDVVLGFDVYEIYGASLRVADIAGNGCCWIVQCLNASKPPAGPDEDMANFQELSRGPPGND